VPTLNRVVGRRAYDFMYRRGAPWEGGPREELVDLVLSGRLNPGDGARALDLGCGSGANAIFLAEHEFDVTGIDFSGVALAKAAAKSQVPRWVQTDLTGDVVKHVPGPFDLVVDYGTLDDLKKARRPALAANIAAWTRPGSQFLLWCFYDEIAWWRRPGARFPGLKVGEENALFADAFSIERLPHPSVGSGFACFLLVRT
jgi:cyclopropane fatty-acyl-phospholipid synthase-like methyltransferase